MYTALQNHYLRFSGHAPNWNMLMVDLEVETETETKKLSEKTAIRDTGVRTGRTRTLTAICSSTSGCSSSAHQNRLRISCREVEQCCPSERQ